MIVAIHQPNFIPWLGFFNKLIKADKFILLDDAQFPKKGGTWTNRTLISLNNERHWLTVPINRNYKGYCRVDEIKIINDNIWKKKILKTIKNSYSKCSYFDLIYSDLSKIILKDHNFLFELNIQILEWLFNLLEIDESKIYFSSNFDVKSTSTQRLIDLTKSLGSQTYLSGDGSSEYIDKNLFDYEKIDLKFTNYNQPTYSQYPFNNSFLTGLSVIDCLFNIGTEGTLKLIYKK